MKTATYFSISIVLIVIALLLSNCGGGTDSGAIPEMASPQQNQNLINTDVKINYWIDDNFITSPTIIENLIYNEASHYLMLWSYGGTVWYDEVKNYDFNECIVNYY